MQVSQLISYPIKSTAPVHHEHIRVYPAGLAYDRHWMVVDRQLAMMTARKYPKLLHVSTIISGSYLKIQVEQHQFTTSLQPESTDNLIVKHWRNKPFAATTLEPAIDDALSDYLQQACQLIHCNTAIEPGKVYDDASSFADTAPVLLTTTNSLADLNQRLLSVIPMARFRPNIVVSGGMANQEDQWHRLRIGDCEFIHTQPCARCILTTINPQTLTRDQHGEPLKTLARYRRLPSGEIGFGINLSVLHTGSVKVGDQVEIIRLR